MTIKEISQLQKKLLGWYRQQGRKFLPWKLHQDPYHIWLSEIMLQQTQVKTVIPYFLKFIKVFPNIKKLALANEDEVLHLWTGLGYYQRARNLLRAAKQIAQQHQGIIPNQFNDVIQLPGIGQSTAGAILSMAFNQSIPILDGNVKRVLTRLFGIDAPIDDKKTLDLLWEKAKILTPDSQAKHYTQAIMDLGSLICTRKQPQCSACPWQNHCFAKQFNRTCDIPQKKISRIKPIRRTSWIILKCNQNIFLQKRLEKNVWQHLWCFPEIHLIHPNKKTLNEFCKMYDLKLLQTKPIPNFRHTFTHYHLDIFPIVIDVIQCSKKTLFKDTHSAWVSLHETPKLGLPQPALKLWMELKS